MAKKGKGGKGKGKGGKGKKPAGFQPEPIDPVKEIKRFSEVYTRNCGNFGAAPTPAAARGATPAGGDMRACLCRCRASRVGVRHGEEVEGR